MTRPTREHEIAEIRGRLRSSFTNSYLTLLSIIQGTALATLFVKVDFLIGRQSFHGPQLLLAVAIGLSIILVWNQYQMGLMVYVWTATLLDAFIPFGIGVCEFSAILGLEHGGKIMLIAYGALFVVGIVAFENQYRQLRRSASSDAFVHELTRGLQVIDVVSCVAAAVICFAGAFAAGVWPDAADLLAGWIIIAISVAQGAREIVSWGRLVQRIFDAN